MSGTGSFQDGFGAMLLNGSFSNAFQTVIHTKATTSKVRLPKCWGMSWHHLGSHSFLSKMGSNVDTGS